MIATPSLKISEVEYFADFNQLDDKQQEENFEKALYRLKGGFGASKRGGPRAFYSAIDEVRDHFVNKTAMEIKDKKIGMISKQVGDYVNAKSFYTKESERS